MSMVITIVALTGRSPNAETVVTIGSQQFRRRAPPAARQSDANFAHRLASCIVYNRVPLPAWRVRD